MEAIMLCRRPGKCCPVFNKEGKNYSISDKDQNTPGKVVLTIEQLKMLLKEATKRVN